MVKIRIRPLNNEIKNSYDSIFKIATHAFTNALIPLIDLPEDDYIVMSSEIFSPGKDVKSMDILLKGEYGYVNIEFHKQPLAKSDLDRDFEYVVECYMFYGQTIDQKIVVVDKNRKSIDRIQVTPQLSYCGNYYYVPDIDGGEVLSNMKNKLETNETPSEYEQYVFSILPLTNHQYVDEEQLMKDLCAITPKLNISEKNREYISLCHMILVELCVHDEFLKEELYDVISMTTTYIEKRENLLKQRIQVAEEKVVDVTNRAVAAEEKVVDVTNRAENAENLLKQIAHDVKNGGKLNRMTIKKLLLVTSKL
ncbi:MAG: hypothetical protein IJ104_11240 [Methanobrevibacter sp.]|nr:hypothetical protein [Methanobrevibacter sp.]